MSRIDIIEGLKREVRKAIDSGHIIATLSQRKAEFEREFGNTVIRHYDRLPATAFPPNIDVVLSVIRIKHTNTSHIHKGNRNAKIRVVQERELREILSSCGCVQPAQPKKGHALNGNAHLATAEPIAQPSPAVEQDDVLYELLVTQENYLRRHAMNEVDEKTVRFAQAFCAKAKANKRMLGFVGKRDLGALSGKCQMNMTNEELKKAGLVIGELLPGGIQIGRYRASEKLLALAEQTPSAPPEDECEFAKWLVTKKPAELAKKQKIEEEMATKLVAINAELADIATAEELLEKLKAFRSSKLAVMSSVRTTTTM